VSTPRLWSVQAANTYTLRTTTTAISTTAISSTPSRAGGGAAEQATDAVNTTVGFRFAHFNTSGFFLNADRVILRGFSDHNSFAGVGVAVPARLNLYRAQMLRAVGGNIW
jgi:hypothetical protein